MFADDVGVGKFTVEKDAERYARDRCVGRHRGNTANRTKAKKPDRSTKMSERRKKIEKKRVIRVLHPRQPLI